jgi:hypothetical protein
MNPRRRFRGPYGGAYQGLPRDDEGKYNVDKAAAMDKELEGVEQSEAFKKSQTAQRA